MSGSYAYLEASLDLAGGLARPPTGTWVFVLHSPGDKPRLLGAHEIQIAARQSIVELPLDRLAEHLSTLAGEGWRADETTRSARQWVYSSVDHLRWDNHQVRLTTA